MNIADPSLPQARRANYFFRRQALHLVLFIILLGLSWVFAVPVLGDGSWLGIADRSWYAWGIGLAVLQQILVWVVWRTQLGWGLLTRLAGKYDLVLWGSVFLPLLLARPIFIAGLAMADRNSLSVPASLSTPLGLILLIPALYTLWSVERFFGFTRALGADHFRPSVRTLPMVRQGAFRWSGNAMYSFAFLGLWSIALLLRSQAALSLALFQHAYVWVHFYCTEAPDLDLIYAAGEKISIASGNRS